MPHALAATICAFGMLAASASDDEDAALSVRVQPPGGVHYVGESLHFTVTVLASSERPELSVPRVPNLDVALVATDLERVSATAIGNLVETKNFYRYRYRVVAQRAGNLEFPPVTARDKGRSGTSRAVRFKVQDVPHDQRPRAFLGGVGAFELAAEAIPAVLRVGQTLEYRIRMSGPGALASHGAPALPPLGKLSVEPDVEPMEAESVAEPPSRLFRYRLRPTRAGEAVLPPVAVATFDPRTARFVTKVTPGVSVRVVDVPRFAATDLQYGASRPAAKGGKGVTLPAPLPYAGVGLIVAALGVLYRLNRVARREVDRACAAAARRARELPPDEPPHILARWIADGLVEYLYLATDRAGGALTPGEADEGIAAATADPELAAQARRLVECADRACYGPGDVSSAELAARGRAVFADLAARPVVPLVLRKTKRGSPDREG